MIPATRSAFSLTLAACLAVAAAGLAAQNAPGIPGVVAPGVEAELVQEGFMFTEGPVGTADGGLYFTDNRASKIHRLDASGRIATFREQTGAANGLAVTKDGEIFAVEAMPPRISKQGRDGRVTTVADKFNGAPFLSPNDLIMDSKGGIYFTDPGPRPVVPGRPTYVFYLPASAQQPIVLDNQVGRPNGLTLTTDGRTLIVADTLNPALLAYDVQPDGTVMNKRTFAQLRDIPAGQESGADGMAVDRDNRLYVSSLTGVQVFDPRGTYLGTIKTGRQPANVAFAGPDKKTLYVTAREGLYRIRMLAQGPDRPGK